jgi:hypothetical protein
METEVELQAMRESLLKSLCVLAVDPTEDFTESEARWVEAFRVQQNNRLVGEVFGI